MKTSTLHIELISLILAIDRYCAMFYKPTILKPPKYFADL